MVVEEGVAEEETAAVEAAESIYLNHQYFFKLDCFQ